MQLSITLEDAVIQSVDADEPVEIVFHIFGDDMSDLRDDGEQTLKSTNGDDCCIHVVGEGQTAQESEHAKDAK